VTQRYHYVTDTVGSLNVTLSRSVSFAYILSYLFLW